MASVITTAGEKLFAAKAQANEQLDIDTFIFANVPAQDPTAPINRDEGLPTDHVVHQQIVQQVGRINDNVVVYSTVLDSVTGPFEFNWVGLYSSVNQVLVAINHIPNTPKTITEPGAAGNTLNRNFGIEYSGIAELTGINVAPETWQLDFTARLNGMDELTRNLAKDLNGSESSFIDDGFKVVPRSTANTFSVLPGVGYVNGLRVELLEEHILIADSYPKNVYVDAYFEGEASSAWKPRHNLHATSDEVVDYIDEAGKQHYSVKIAMINAFDDVDDVRVSFTEKEETFIRNFSGDPKKTKNLTDKLLSVLASNDSARVGTGLFKMSTFTLSENQGVRGESYSKSSLFFNEKGIAFIGARTEVSSLKLSGMPNETALNPETGLLGNVGLTHQDLPNSGVSIMDKILVEGFDTGYSESSAGNLWTGGYRKIINSEFNYLKIGLSCVGGSTDLRVSNTDIRNCIKNAIYLECKLPSQYANIRLTQVLIEGCGAIGNLTGKAKDAGLYIGAYSQLSLDSGYLEKTSVCVGEKGSFKLSNTYKNNGVRIFGTGFILIDGNYETYNLAIPENLTEGWDKSGCTVNQNPEGGKGGGAISVKSSGDGFTSLTSEYDLNIQKEMTVTSGNEAFLFVQCRARTTSKPIGNWFGPLLRATFIDTGANAWTNNVDLDLDPEQIEAISTDWAYVNYIIPIRFDKSVGLDPEEYLKWVRLQFIFTDAGYTRANDGEFEVQIKKVQAKLYLPKV